MSISTQGLFGGPQGDIAWTNNEQTKASTALSRAQASVIPSQIDHNQALTSLANAQASKLKQEQQDAEMMGAIMKEGASADAADTSPDAVLSRIDKGTDLAFKQGKFTLATKLADEGRKMREGKARMDEHQSNARKHDLETRLKAAEELHTYFAGVDAADPTSWAAAKLAYHAEHPGMLTPKIFEEYNPEVIKNVQARSKDYRENVKQDLDAFNKEEKVRHDKATEAAASRRAAAAEARVGVARAAEARKAKAGGKEAPAAGAPDSKMIAFTQTLIAKDYPELKPDMALGKDNVTTSAAYAVASDAKVRIRENKALSTEEAVAQAYGAAVARGDFKVVETPGTKILGMEFGKKKAVEFSRADAMPIPQGAKPSDLKVGTVYKNPKGEKATWNGKIFVPVGGGKGAPAKRAATVSADDDEEE